MNKKIIIIILSIITLISIIFNIYYLDKYQIEKYRAINSENNYKANSFVHFSIDDCINVFYDLDNKQEKYNSIFDNKLLKYLKKLNTEYGCKFSLYVFEKNDVFDIENCTTKYKEEFEENSDWLKFGFHALSGNSDYNHDSENIEKDYNTVINNLTKIVGKNSITNTFRMEKFLLNKENARKLKEQIGEYSLLGADTENRLDYYLTEEQNRQVFMDEYYFDEELRNIYL